MKISTVSNTATAPRGSASNDAPRRALQTNEAARYLGVSRSLLRKMRMRGPADPQGAGPSFIKLSPQLVVYDIAELDRWLDAHDVKSSGRAA